MTPSQLIPTKKIDGIPLYQTIRYPEIPLSEDDIYVYTTQEDRYDTLAEDWYGDSSLWKIISIANPIYEQNSLIVPEGVQIRIPTNPQGVLQQIKSINL